MSMRWYVVHVFSGMEKKVQSSLQERIERAGLQSSFGRILVPTEEVVESRGGQRAVTERRIFPGYVLVEMEFCEEHKSCNRVFGWYRLTPYTNP